MYERILVAVDGSQPSRRGMEEAIRIAKGTGAKMKFVHVINEPIIPDIDVAAYYGPLMNALREAGGKILEEATSRAREEGVPCEDKMLESIRRRAADEIVKEAKAWPADLIVLGTHGRSGFKRLTLGSDAELVVRQSPVPVLLIRDSADTSVEANQT